MSSVSEASKGAVSGAMPWVILLGGAVVLFWWLRNKATGAAGQPGIGFTPDQLTSPMFGACSTGWRWLLNVDNCRSGQITTPSGPTDGGMFYPSPNLTPTPGNLMDEFARDPAGYCSRNPGFYFCPVTSQPTIGIPSAPSPVAPLLDEPPAPADHYSPVWSPGAVQDIIQQHAPVLPIGLISSYNQVRQYDTNRYQIPAGFQGSMVQADFFDPGTGEYLDISPYGWVVYRQDYSTLNPTGWANKRGSTAFGGLTHELPGWLG